MSNITIAVEFLAGTPIDQAITEAKEKACMWDVTYVCFNFNGTGFSVSRKADVYEMVEEFKSTVGDKHPYILLVEER